MPMAAPVLAGGGVAPAAAPAAPKADKAAGEPFLSPMVGTFYRASSPEAKAFVMEGDTVAADATLCIIEAMKVMNEIKAEKPGKVLQILVENGEAVEYGQPLFLIQR
jgi:acetyl-CoA carboxylase biotin carboxyl carrier protein